MATRTRAKKIPKRDRERFVKGAKDLLRSLGAMEDEEAFYPFTLQTKIGSLRLHVTPDRLDGLGIVFTRFDNAEAAHKLLGVNIFSGKWNHFYFSEYTVDSALADLRWQLERVL